MATNFQATGQQGLQIGPRARKAANKQVSKLYDKAVDKQELGLDNWQGVQNQFQAPQDMYYDSLGVNGQEGNDRAFDAYRNSAQYKNALDMFGMDAQTIQRLNASNGNLFSGNTGIALNDRARTLQNLGFGDWQNKLNFTNPLMGAAGGYGNMATNLANLFAGEAALKSSNWMQGAGLQQSGSNTLAGLQAQQQMAKDAETPMWEKLLLGGVSAAGTALGGL